MTEKYTSPISRDPRATMFLLVNRQKPKRFLRGFVANWVVLQSLFVTNEQKLDPQDPSSSPNGIVQAHLHPDRRTERVSPRIFSDEISVKNKEQEITLIWMRKVYMYFSKIHVHFAVDTVLSKWIHVLFQDVLYFSKMYCTFREDVHVLFQDTCIWTTSFHLVMES
jgi:hypothetical protein